MNICQDAERENEAERTVEIKLVLISGGGGRWTCLSEL